MSGRCIVCNKPASLWCSKCKAVNYCCRDHQVDHWKKGHKTQCMILSSNAGPEYITHSTELSSTDNRKALPTEEWLIQPDRVKKMVTFDPTLGRGIGMSNFGNTCYFNSVLQCYLYTKPLVNYLLNDEHLDRCILTKENKFCLICALKVFLNEIHDRDRPYARPEFLYRNLKNIGDFAWGQQEDAHDFAYAVLNSIQKSLLSNEPSKPSFKQEETSLIYQLFGGYMKSVIKCKRCSHVSSSFESFLDIMVDLTGNVTSLEEGLHNFMKIEELDESKQMSIYEAPNVLCITLKRFDIMQGGCKVNRTVVYRPLLSLSRNMSQNSPDKSTDYELYAVVVHFGSSIFVGHYVAFVKNNGQWYLLDDSCVTHVSESQVLQQNAYMMFYQKTYGRETKTNLSKSSQTQELKISSSSAPTDDVMGNREVNSYSTLYSSMKDHELGDSKRQDAFKMYKDQMKNVGRNDQCPCGSGKKYKNCHQTFVQHTITMSDVQAFLTHTFAEGLEDNHADVTNKFHAIVAQLKPDGQKRIQMRKQIIEAAKTSSGSPPQVLDRVELLNDQLFSYGEYAARNGGQQYALFFPDDPKSYDRFYTLLKSAKKTLDVCVFTITDDRTANEIIKAHQRGVKVRVITDDEKALDLGADISRIIDAGIAVETDNSPFHMHHKFCIVDNAVLLNGSFNWTRSASNSNHENVAVSDTPSLIAAFHTEFDRLWAKFAGTVDSGKKEAAAKVVSQQKARGH
ncbi:ubiquitin specific protease 42 [Planoprotostelium fungivorum]|uniref:Ubiquitin carboxyl-terminal hydrolase n=1 Tax=Planoprotostelium fungivorum TaxID=1890364 RepID=A0A2P6N057_9EUKA|nr:ubiquitin specific protease 42 [Planoprotostelium fungivorum]